MGERAVSKYLNKKTTVHGITFDSKAEASRYLELVILQNAGEITNLELQVQFEIFPKQEGERAAHYVADFVYYEDGVKVVEDCKGMKTKDYILKRKGMLFRHGIKIKETGK
jgi:hypothetical protein